MTHHNLDLYPVPGSESSLYINEPELIDKSLLEHSVDRTAEAPADNVRIYVPMDLNGKAILRRLDRVIAQYGEATEANEIEFSIDVDMIISQLEIYDQVWDVHHMPDEGKHSDEAKVLVKEMIARLEEIPDSCAEVFPFDTIEMLRAEYL